MQEDRFVRIASLFVRMALAASFLSATADRFGWWGPPGANGVAWGDLEHYEAYVGKLNWFLPQTLIPMIGWIATVAEILAAVALIVGWRLRWSALAAAILLTTFAARMTAALGPKPALDYSVPTAAGAAWLLFAVAPPNAAARRQEKTFKETP